MVRNGRRKKKGRRTLGRGKKKKIDWEKAKEDVKKQNETGKAKEGYRR